MEQRTAKATRFRISCLSSEYLSKFRKVKRIITQYTGLDPSMELTIESMIDEFLNLHVGADWDVSNKDVESVCS